jgi:ribosomal protein S18 acetylase RimI-like enzyme
MAHDSSSLLIGCGRDVEKVFGAAPNAMCRVDEHGWLGLSGEAGAADLNMAAVVRGADPSLVEEYIDDIRGRGLDAILIVDEDAPELDAAAEALGLPKVGNVPIMVWENQPPPVPSTRYQARIIEGTDVPIAAELAASAFSLDLEKVTRVLQPEITKVSDIWVVEDDGEPLGMGMFVHSGDHVGIYTMSTPERSQRRGVGRAVLDNAMAHYVDRGATTFTLEATEAGYHLYEQVGFATVATPPVYVTAPSTQFPGT